MEGFIIASFLLLLVVTIEANAATQHNENIGSFIFGGRPALQGEVPYQLSLEQNGSHYCSAALCEVNGTQIGLTAAHCVQKYQHLSFVVVAGDLNRNDTTGFEQKLPVQRLLIHQNYSSATTQNDIAILLLNGSFQLNENVSTVSLPTQGRIIDQGNVRVSGWGAITFPYLDPSIDLQVAEIPLVNDTECQRIYKNYLIRVVDSMICANAPGEGASPCENDGGGPAVSDDGYLAGIVSWVYFGQCGHPNYPAVFTKVSYFIDWIHDTMASV